MTGQERVRCAFEHKTGDRVPLYEQGVARDVASAILGREALTGLTGLHKLEADAWSAGASAAEEFYEQVLRDCVDLAKQLELDAVSPPWLIWSAPTKKLDEHTYLWGELESNNYIIRKYDPITDTMGVFDSCVMHWSIEDLTQFVENMKTGYAYRSLPTQADFWMYAHMKEMAGDMAVIGGSGLAVPLDEIWLTACALCPETVDSYLQICLEQSLDGLRVQKEMGIGYIWGGGDMASNHGPIYSPAFFRKHLLPKWQETTELCKELGLKYVFRTDGDLWSIAQEVFVDAGFDGYGEIDVDAGMDIRRLKNNYGHLTFWGNISCGKTLRLGSVAEVVEKTKKLIDDAAASGGLIAGSSNTILYGTPPENFVAMLETVKTYGRY